VKDCGVAGMVRSALWVDTRFGGEVLFLGRGALAREDCELQIALTHLLVNISLRGTWIWVYACGLDEDAPEFLFNVGDTPQGWTTVRAFVQALERSGIKSLHPRPLHIGSETGAGAYVIA
jgi:hypothetical protein